MTMSSFLLLSAKLFPVLALIVTAFRPPETSLLKISADLSDLHGFGAFVINLESQQDRLEGFREAVGRSQPWLLPVLHRVPGVDGESLLENETRCKELVDENYITAENLRQASDNKDGASSWYDLSPGAVGLYLSHQDAWAEIVRRDLKHGVIFEDDLRYFAPDFEKNLRKMLRGESQADVAYLQHCLDSSAWPLGAETGESGWGNAVSRPIQDSEIVPCTACYFLSRRGAERLLQQAFPISEQVDRAMSRSSTWLGMGRLIYEPALAQVGPESYQSSIQNNGLCQKFGWRVVRALGMWSRHIFRVFCAL